MPCSQVTISKPNKSDITIGNVQASSTGADSAEASATVTNTPTSGGGTSRTVDVELTVDGSVEATDTVTVAAGQAEGVQFQVSGLSSGTHTLCVQKR